MAGVGIRTVAQLMGHRTIQITMRYAHLALEHNQGVVEKLVSPWEEVVTKLATTNFIAMDRNIKIAVSVINIKT
jgi:hypothetical protein